MKGVILAGGLGTRLLPLTKVTNKHLLPVYNKPMIYYPLEKLAEAGLKEIMIITGPENAGDFIKLLGSGEEFGVDLQYKLQDKPRGIAHAIGLADHFVGKNKCVIILGDNIFEDNIKEFVEEFENSFGARIFLKEIPDPQRFGVAEIDKNGKVLNIEEKPKKPKSNYAVTGLYMYDSSVFDIIKTLKPSAREELEVTDLNNAYLKHGKMHATILKGFWSDAGTIETLFKASELIRKRTMH